MNKSQLFYLYRAEKFFLLLGVWYYISIFIFEKNLKIRKMKKLFLILTAALLFWAFVPGNKNKTATVNSIQGVYIFYNSEPVDAYEIVGTLDVNMTLNGDLDERVKKYIKKLNKKFPGAHGIIFKGLTFDDGEVIKFNE